MSFGDFKETAGSSEEFKPVPAGMHPAVCFAVVHLGTQKWKWLEEEKQGHKLMLGFETPGQTIGEGVPMKIWKEYTISFHEKANLGKDLSGWFNGENPDGDMQSWLDSEVPGRKAYLNVENKESGNGRMYGKILAIMPLPGELGSFEQHNDTIRFEMFGEFNKTEFDKIPEFIQKKIMESREYKAFMGAGETEEEGMVLED